MAGHVATSLATFWNPLSFSLQQQWWVWYIVVWANGGREPSEEDYPPWIVVSQIKSGTFIWEKDDVHRGEYKAEWLPQTQRAEMLADLGIGPNDF